MTSIAKPPVKHPTARTNGIGLETQKLLDLAVATDWFEVLIEEKIGDDDLLIVDAEGRLAQRSDNHTREIDLTRELARHARLFP